MVQAILSGQKTRTMRVMNPQPPWGRPVVNSESAVNPIWKTWTAGLPLECQPQHRVGDIIYVRETWGIGIQLAGGVIYKADYAEGKAPLADGEKWRPSIHMPKAAARIFLRITDVKVQRPQELTMDEIVAEGVICPIEKTCMCENDDYMDCKSYRGEWVKLWDSVQSKKDLPLYGYQANPWCFAYLFEKVVPDDQ